MTSIDRREFVRLGAIAGTLALTRDPTRVNELLPPETPRRTVSPAFELDEVTIAQLQDGITSGQHTSRSLVEAYLAHIEDVDAAGRP